MSTRTNTRPREKGGSKTNILPCETEEVLPIVLSPGELAVRDELPEFKQAMAIPAGGGPRDG